MSTTLTLNEERRMVERRLIHKRKIDAERKKASQKVKSLQRVTNKYNLVLELLGSVLAVAVGIMVLFFTGILSGASSTVIQIVLIIVIVYAYVEIFRRAFYS